MLEIAEVDVVASSLSRQQRVQRMMEVIVPLRIKSVPAQLRRTNDTGVVQRAFSNHIRSPIQLGSSLVDGIAELFQKVQCGMIQDCVHGIEAQSVDVIVRNPL